MRHDLKIHPEYFEAVLSWEKAFEIRKNDRDFKPGDLLNLMEWVPMQGENEGGYFTGRSCLRYIAHVSSYMQKENFAVLGFRVPGIPGTASAEK